MLKNEFLPLVRFVYGPFLS